MTAITLHFPGEFPGATVRSRRLPASVYWRRRAAVVLVLLGMGLAGQAALGVLGDGPLTVAEATPSGALPVVELDTEPVAQQVHVVRPGDTLWSIARALQPSGDVRPLVDALASQRDGRPLQPGERIALP